jgi:hypothetical protein
MSDASFDLARRAIDAAHSGDPRRTTDGSPAELVYADRMEAWIIRLDPAAPPLPPPPPPPLARFGATCIAVAAAPPPPRGVERREDAAGRTKPIRHGCSETSVG